MLVSRQGDRDFVKVLDFGLAKMAPEALAKEDGTPGQALTKHGTVFGTPKYMAPEQCVSGPVDGRTDLYALGVILYEMLTGVNPFAGKDLVATIRNQLSKQTPPMKSVAANVAVPEALEAMARRLTAKQADDRFPTATSVLDALAEFAAAEGYTTPEHSGRHDAPSGAHKSAPQKPVDPVAKTVMSVDVIAIEESAPKPAAPPTAEKSAESKPVVEKPAEPVPALAPAPVSKPAPGSTPAQDLDKRLQQLLERLPPPLQKQPAMLLAPLAVLGLLLFVLLRACSPGKPAKPDAVGGPAPKAGAQAPREQIDQAVGQGQPALLVLAKQFPADVRVLRAVAHTYMAQRDGVQALHWLGKAVAVDARPSVVQDGEIVQAVTMTQASPDVMEELTGLLETELGSRGADALYILATRPGPPKVRARFNQSLNKVAVRTQASASARIAIELRAAEGCDAKHALLGRAAKEGDARALQQLQALTQTRNCGPYGLADCWSCLRQDDALKSAITAVEARVRSAH